jgi:hypothetical protein
VIGEYRFDQVDFVLVLETAHCFASDKHCKILHYFLPNPKSHSTNNIKEPGHITCENINKPLISWICPHQITHLPSPGDPLIKEIQCPNLVIVLLVG